MTICITSCDLGVYLRKQLAQKPSSCFFPLMHGPKSLGKSCIQGALKVIGPLKYFNLSLVCLKCVKRISWNTFIWKLRDYWVGVNCSKFDCSTINWSTLLAGNQLLDTKFINCSNPVNPVEQLTLPSSATYKLKK